MKGATPTGWKRANRRVAALRFGTFDWPRKADDERNGLMSAEDRSDVKSPMGRVVDSLVEVHGDLEFMVELAPPEMESDLAEVAVNLAAAIGALLSLSRDRCDPDPDGDHASEPAPSPAEQETRPDCRAQAEGFPWDDFETLTGEGRY